MRLKIHATWPVLSIECSEIIFAAYNNGPQFNIKTKPLVVSIITTPRQNMMIRLAVN